MLPSRNDEPLGSPVTSSHHGMCVHLGWRSVTDARVADEVTGGRIAAMATQRPRKAETSSPPKLECSDVTAGQSGGSGI